MNRELIQPFEICHEVNNIKLVYHPPWSNKYFGISGSKNYPHTESNEYRKLYYNGNGWCHETYFATVNIQGTDNQGEKIEFDVTDYVRDNINQRRLTAQAVERTSINLPKTVYVKESSNGYYTLD